MTEEKQAQLRIVPPPLPVPFHFERLQGVIEEALEGGFFTLDDVAKAIVENKAQFWPGANSVIITEIQDYPSEKVIQVWVAGGDMEEIMSMAPGIEAWARLQGCTAVLVEGRQGWARVLSDKGYKPFSYTAKKVL